MNGTVKYSAFVFCMLMFSLQEVTASTLVIQKPEDPTTKEASRNNIEFEAHRNGTNVELKWAVTGFVKYFYVERSLDRVNWEPILSMTGSNQSYHRTEYFDIDYEVPSTKLFYRIKQVYFSGETSSSHTVFVPPFDDLSAHQERMIKSISDPITVGAKLDLYFVNFAGEDLLLVLRDQCQQEYYAKVRYLSDEGLYEVVNLSGDIPSGQYLITASSKKHIYSSSLRIEYSN